ncbi:MAG TPA: hypothetical protein P5560_13135, partial [Thermotogota bacterium]|nr:hypothetical protein [Thermotogota bacterium]
MVEMHIHPKILPWEPRAPVGGGVPFRAWQVELHTFFIVGSVYSGCKKNPEVKENEESNDDGSNT